MGSGELDQVLRHLDAHRPRERTLATLRSYVDAMVAMEPPLADVSVEAITVGGVPAERLLARGADARRTLLYLHGGGYSLGSAKGYRPFAGRIARAFDGATVVLDYRLAPEHPFPAGLDDATAALRELLASGDAARVVVGGDSAGGGLALGAMLALRDAGEPLPAAAALLSPWVDLEWKDEMEPRAASDPIVTREGMRALAALYLGERDRADPRVAPLRAKLDGLPPLLLQVGEREIQLSDVQAFAAKAREAGVSIDLEVWEGMIHVFQMFPVLPDAQRAVAAIGAFLQSKTGSKGSAS